MQQCASALPSVLLCRPLELSRCGGECCRPTLATATRMWQSRQQLTRQRAIACEASAARCHAAQHVLHTTSAQGCAWQGFLQGSTVAQLLVCVFAAHYCMQVVCFQVVQQVMDQVVQLVMGSAVCVTVTAGLHRQLVWCCKTVCTFLRVCCGDHAAL